MARPRREPTPRRRSAGLGPAEAPVFRSVDTLDRECLAHFWSGRFSQALGVDAPEIDGMVILQGEAPIGEFVAVKIDGALTYDLTGQVELEQGQVITLQ